MNLEKETANFTKYDFRAMKITNQFKKIELQEEIETVKIKIKFCKEKLKEIGQT